MLEPWLVELLRLQVLLTVWRYFERNRNWCLPIDLAASLLR
jgi:hypothetical protein